MKALGYNMLSDSEISLEESLTNNELKEAIEIVS